MTDETTTIEQPADETTEATAEATNGFLSADDILGADDQEFAIVEAWGGRVRIKTLEGHELGRIQVLYQARKGNVPDFRERIVAATACDAEGNLIFKPAQLKLLGKKSAAEIGKVYDAACRLNGLSDEDKAELEGN